MVGWSLLSPRIQGGIAHIHSLEQPPVGRRCGASVRQGFSCWIWVAGGPEPPGQPLAFRRYHRMDSLPPWAKLHVGTHWRHWRAPIERSSGAHLLSLISPPHALVTLHPPSTPSHILLLDDLFPFLCFHFPILYITGSPLVLAVTLLHLHCPFYNISPAFWRAFDWDPPP